jgi:single-stranded-DNA-specific exonuclease
VNRQSIDELCAQGVKLIITVDCGISAPDEVQYAQNLGIVFIVTDHHNAVNRLPPAVAVVNPKNWTG